MNYIESDECLEDLQIGGFFLLQKKIGFRFGIDAVLLSDFVNEKGGNMIDLCSGSGIVPILCLAKNKAFHIEAVEIMPKICDMANRSMKINKIEEKILVKNVDLRQIDSEYKPHIFDFVTCNPPYIKCGSGEASNNDIRSVARHEISCTIDDVGWAASYLLKNKGRFYMIHKAFRLVDIFLALTKYNLEPKTMRFVTSSNDKKPSMVLIEAVYQGKRQLNVEPVLVV